MWCGTIPLPVSPWNVVLCCWQREGKWSPDQSSNRCCSKQKCGQIIGIAGLTRECGVNWIPAEGERDKLQMAWSASLADFKASWQYNLREHRETHRLPAWADTPFLTFPTNNAEIFRLQMVGRLSERVHLFFFFHSPSSILYSLKPWNYNFYGEQDGFNSYTPAIIN